MHILIDTNILISAALFPNGKAAEALTKALLPPYKPYTCDYILNELRSKFIEKFPDKLDALNSFLALSLPVIKVIVTPDQSVDEETKIRDIKDRPILRAAQLSGMDLLLTGDKDFLEADITVPRIVGVAEFLSL